MATNWARTCSIRTTREPLSECSLRRQVFTLSSWRLPIHLSRTARRLTLSTSLMRLHKLCDLSGKSITALERKQARAIRNQRSHRLKSCPTYQAPILRPADYTTLGVSIRESTASRTYRELSESADLVPCPANARDSCTSRPSKVKDSPQSQRPILKE